MPRRHADIVAAVIRLRRRIEARARRRLREGRLRIARASERRRMTRIRRRPAALTTLLRSATRILIVCHGNIIRSPFAARLMQHMLAIRVPVSVASAGVHATAGKGADPAAIAAARPFGIELRDHVAEALTASVVAAADVIFAMDTSQLVRMRERFPWAGERMFLMASLCRHTPLEIADPFGGDAAKVQDCYAQISRSVRAVVDAIVEPRALGGPVYRSPHLAAARSAKPEPDRSGS